MMVRLINSKNGIYNKLHRAKKTSIYYEEVSNYTSEYRGKIIDGKTRPYNGVGKKVNDIAADFTASGRGEETRSRARPQRHQLIRCKWENTILYRVRIFGILISRFNTRRTYRERWSAAPLCCAATIRRLIL